MEQLTIDIGGKTVTYRGLTRKEVRDLRKSGMNLSDLDPAWAEDAMDTVFSMVLSDDDNRHMDNLLARKAYSLWRKILAATYRDPDAEKNLSPGGNGSPETGPDTATPAGNPTAPGN